MKQSLVVPCVLMSLALACSRGDDGDDAPDARRNDARVGPDSPGGTDAPQLPDGARPPDGAGGSDAPRPVDARIFDAGPSLAPTLLLTEVKTVGADEFVEIYNPTDHSIDLRNYYLADVNSYFTLPAGAPTLNGDQSDFVVRFPAGSTIAAREVITVATDAVGFADGTNGFGVAPNYAIDEPGAATPMDRISYIAPMSGQTGPALTNDGEMVVLFFWDGASDLVEDVDIMIAGIAPSASNTLVAKTATDGPDANSTPTAYTTDLLTIGDMEADLAGDQVYERSAFEVLHEIQAGAGNGISGDDETSEMIRDTWDIVATGTPGSVPVALQ